MSEAGSSGCEEGVRDQDPRIAEEATVGLNVLSMDWPRLIGSASHTLAVKPFVGKKTTFKSQFSQGNR